MEHIYGCATADLDYVLAGGLECDDTAQGRVDVRVDIHVDVRRIEPFRAFEFRNVAA
jgi:hypothetical protein